MTISFEDLENQRAEFALDSAVDRPYHHLAHAFNRRGRPWSRAVDQTSTSLLREARRSDLVNRRMGIGYAREYDRLRRLYVSEAPFLRTRAHGDGESWSIALRRGRPATVR